jgi:hypothetical protein
VPGGTTTTSPAVAILVSEPSRNRMVPSTISNRSSCKGWTCLALGAPPGARKRSTRSSSPALSRPRVWKTTRSPVAEFTMTWPFEGMLVMSLDRVTGAGKARHRRTQCPRTPTPTTSVRAPGNGGTSRSGPFSRYAYSTTTLPLMPVCTWQSKYNVPASRGPTS